MQSGETHEGTHRTLGCNRYAVFCGVEVTDGRGVTASTSAARGRRQAEGTVPTYRCATPKFIGRTVTSTSPAPRIRSLNASGAGNAAMDRWR